MKLVLSCCTLFLAILGSVSAQAVEPLALYDDFNGDSIDASKWSGQQSGLLLDVAREIRGEGRLHLADVAREIPGERRLHLAAKALGIASFPGQTSGARVRLAFANSGAVEAIRAVVEVRKVEATGCPTDLDPNSNPTRARLRLSGFFFDDGTNTNRDLLAMVVIERRSDSTDPQGVLRVLGRLFHCADANCLAGEDLVIPVNLGSITLGERVRLRIQWDKDVDQFIFQRDGQPEITASYLGLVLDANPPTNIGKRIEIAHEVANCSGPGSTAFMEALVNNVFVNASAAPGP